MAPHLAFSYREFHDVPRSLVLSHRASTLLLESAFDDERDDYSPEYTVYELPLDIDLSGSWVGLSERAMREVGKIPVVAIVFDPSKRSFIDATAFDAFATKAGWW